MELTQSRSGDIQGYSLGDGTWDTTFTITKPSESREYDGRLHHISTY